MNKIDFEISAFKQLKKYPENIFYKGNLELLSRPKIAFVGTRKPFSYTQILTHQLASKLSSLNICIVSGGAIGVDTIAHKASGTNNTIMVSPCGLNHKYPAINRKLIEDIENNGLILSTYADDFKATNWSFVQRNELVVALGDVLVVTQADLNSGSLRSVEYALKMGKEVFTIPHRIGESEGTNQLLKTGLAKAIYNIDEFVSKFGDIKKESIKDEFLEYCKNHPIYDDVVTKYASKIFEYELEGKIRVENGKVFVN